MTDPCNPHGAEGAPHYRYPLCSPLHQPPAFDATVIVAALDDRFTNLKKDTAVSLKSFADAIKASPSAPTPPQLHPPKTKNSGPHPNGECLPQAMVCYWGCIDPTNCPSFTELIPKLNNTLHDHPKYLHIQVVGVKRTQASNLLVHAQAPSPHTLVAALEAVHLALIVEQCNIFYILQQVLYSLP